MIMTEEVHFWKLVRDDQGRIRTWTLVDANPPALQTWGRATVEDVRGKTTDEIFGPGSTEHYLPIVQKVMSEGVPHVYEDFFSPLDRYFRFATVPLGEYFITTGADITRVKKAEESLRQLNAELEQRVADRTADVVAAGAYNRSLIETSVDPLVTIGPDGTITDVNVATEAATGCPRDALIGTDFSEYFSEPETARAGFQRAFREGIVRDYPLEIRSRNGRLMSVLYNATVYRDERGQVSGVFAAARDLTGRLRSERALAERTGQVERQADQLRALATELAQTEQRERQRLAKVLHDNIQQLLVAAQIQLNLIKRSNRQTMQATVDGLESILAETLEASRSLIVELCPPVLHQSGLASALTWLSARFEEKQQFTMRFRADSDAEPDSPDVRAFLFEATREILLNAAKHSGSREAQVTLMRAGDACCRIIVEDRGRGFDPPSLKPGASGGFGLFSIQQRLLYMGGTLEIESAPGEGTRAVLTIPIRRHAASEEGPVTPPPEGGAAWVSFRQQARKISVLLVDDHQIMRQGLASLLQFENDIEIVAEAEDGERALEAARRHTPDVVVMDVNMPVMNGIDATRLLMKELPGTKVIALSMHLDGDAASAMREAGAVAYLTKGGPSEDLVAAIREHAAGKNPPANPPGARRSSRVPRGPKS
jgi:PAS domain S-box-containing protein